MKTQPTKRQPVSQKPVVEVYTDGGCSPNPGLGGWAAILVHPATGAEKVLYGSEESSTNNRMELQAVIEALTALKTACQVRIWTDSQYLCNTMTQGWKRKANHDLWHELDELCQLHDVHWEWVKGHAGHKYNERCDSLVHQARSEAQRIRV